MKRKTIVTALFLLITLYIPLSVFSQDFEMKGTVLVRYGGNAANVTIPAGVTSIGASAFFRCSSLSAVTISRKTSIDKNTFPTTARITYSD